MLINIRRLSALFIVSIGAGAQVSFGQEIQESRNHVFFHPTLTVLSLVLPEMPVVLGLTYERYLESPGKSFIWQPQVIAGSAESGDDIEFSQFSVTNYLGLRQYFGYGGHRGFYIQGSGAAQLGALGAKQKGNPNEVSGFASAFGVLGYLGYKWTHVFMDIGGGVQTSNGTLTFDDGQEIEVSVSGPALDLNLGFGF